MIPDSLNTVKAITLKRAWSKIDKILTKEQIYKEVKKKNGEHGTKESDKETEK